MPTLRPFTFPARFTLGCFAAAWSSALAQEAPTPCYESRLVLTPPSARRGSDGAAAATRRTDAPAPRAQVHTTRPGPWGEIEYFTTFLEAPLELLKAMEVSSLTLEWIFAGQREQDVAALIRALDLSAEIRADLDPARWKREEGRIVVTPSPQTIEALPAAARAAIYDVLARSPLNRFHLEPKIVPGGDARAWLAAAPLRPEIVATIQKTLHRRGQTALFSDTALILRMAVSDAERLQIRKALSRTPALVCKLRLGPGASAEKLAGYWSAGRRFKDIEPFLGAMIETEGVERIDLLHLLPASVRRLLYTFPHETHGRTGYYPDCHWTTLNFFNYEPLERLAEPPLAAAYTLENYERVPKPERLGDVLFLMDEKSGEAYHSCVFIADDIVFTKNGRSPASPWVLMKLGDVQELYAIYQKTQTVAWRRKALP